MNLVHLEYFVEAAQAGDCKTAAKKLFVTTQTVSKAITSLEAKHRISLIDRTQNGVVLTPPGKTFLEKSLLLLAVQADLLDSIKYSASDEKSSEVLSVASVFSPSEGMTLNPKVFASFQKEHPRVELNIMNRSKATCLSAVEEGLVDAAIIVGRSASDIVSCRRIQEIQPCVILASSHPLANTKTVDLKKLGKISVARPDDLQFFQEKIQFHLTKRGCSFAFADVPAQPAERQKFLEEEQGVVFAFEGPMLSRFYPKACIKSLSPSDLFSVPLCFVRNKLSRSTSAIKLEYFLASKSLF